MPCEQHQKHMMFEHVHMIFKNDQGVFVLDGQLIKLYKQLDIIEPSEIVLNLTNISPTSTQKIQQDQSTAPPASPLKDKDKITAIEASKAFFKSEMLAKVTHKTQHY